MHAFKVRVTGRVQGVSFRAYCEDTATKLGLAGWVRNCRDGSVEAFAQGDRPALHEFIQWCHRGSPAAHVEDVDLEPADPDPAVTSFSIQSTV